MAKSYGKLSCGSRTSTRNKKIPRKKGKEEEKEDSKEDGEKSERTRNKEETAK
jgi:hypothetical protein